MGLFMFLALAALLLLSGNGVATGGQNIGSGPAAILLGVVVVLIMGVLLVVAFVAGAWWTERQVRLGAEIATTAQSVNDRWDERKTAAFANLAREMIRLGQSPHGSSPPALLGAGDRGDELLAPLERFRVVSDGAAPHPHHDSDGG